MKGYLFSEGYLFTGFYGNVTWENLRLRVVISKKNPFTLIITTVKPALSDHRFKRPPAFGDRFFMHGESAIQNNLY